MLTTEWRQSQKESQKECQKEGCCDLRSVLLAGTALLPVSFAADALAQSSTSSTETYVYDALGRVISVTTAGGQNEGETQELNYDDAGNRVTYETSTGAASPPPPPPPPPSNTPPSTTADFAPGECSTFLTVNLTANDTDPEGNYPLNLTGVTKTSGAGSAVVVSSSTVSVSFGPGGDISQFTYTVEDTLGAASTGHLTLSTSTCGGGGPLL